MAHVSLRRVSSGRWQFNRIVSILFDPGARVWDLAELSFGLDDFSAGLLELGKLPARYLTPYLFL